MNSTIVTVDLDWACEAAIEQTLDFLLSHNIVPTLFTTHDSPIVESAIKEIEVGLHPFFNHKSSHGSTIPEVVSRVLNIPHNLKAYRCHRYATCNSSSQAMAEAGMLLSSNVCTDLQVVTPFRDRFGLLEVPIFLEDGGYLWRGHPLNVDKRILGHGVGKEPKVITIHPMHFAVNTPHFQYMVDIKKSLGRKEWNEMTSETLNSISWKGRGIRDFLVEYLTAFPHTVPLGHLLTTSQ